MAQQIENFYQATLIACEEINDAIKSGKKGKSYKSGKEAIDDMLKTESELGL